jgi:hypothetical protein
MITRSAIVAGMVCAAIALQAQTAPPRLTTRWMPQ